MHRIKKNNSSHEKIMDSFRTTRLLASQYKDVAKTSFWHRDNV